MTADIETVFDYSKFIDASRPIVEMHPLQTVTKRVINHDKTVSFQIVRNHVHAFQKMIIYKKGVQGTRERNCNEPRVDTFTDHSLLKNDLKKNSLLSYLSTNRIDGINSHKPHTNWAECVIVTVCSGMKREVKRPGRIHDTMVKNLRTKYATCLLKRLSKF